MTRSDTTPRPPSKLEEAAEVLRLRMVKDVFGAETFERPSPRLDALAEDDRRFLVEYMRDQAQVDAGYFGATVNAMALPPEFQAEVAGGWSGNANADADKLLKWAFAKEWFPAHSERSDYTVAGALLEQLTRQTGGDKAKRIGGLVIRHSLIRNPKSLDDLRGRLSLNG